MATVLQQDVWSLTGATGLGKMVSDVNTAMVEGPLAGAAGVLDFISKLSQKFDGILNGWTPQEGETGFSQADMAALLERMQNRWLGIIATRQKITVSVAVKTSRSQAERLSAELGLGYGAAGFTGNVGAGYERATQTGADVSAAYSYEAESIAPEGSAWAAISGTVQDAPASLSAKLAEALNKAITEALS